jgi:hypothetical protein
MPLYVPYPGGSNVLQTVSVKLAADASRTLTTFATLLSTSITKVAGTNLLIWASWTTSFSAYFARSAMLRLMVNGAQVLRAGEEEWTVAQSGGFVYRATGLAAGARTIALQWRIATAGDGTFYCRPATVEPEGASIIVMEVTT